MTLEEAKKNWDDLRKGRISKDEYQARLGDVRREPETVIVLDVGGEGESIVAGVLKKLGKKDVVVHGFVPGLRHHPDVTADGVTFEVKHQPQAEEYGSVFVETSWKGMPSGARVSSSIWQAIVLVSRVLFIKTTDLAASLHFAELDLSFGWKAADGGDNGQAKGFVVKLDRFEKGAFPSLFVVKR